MSCYLWNVGLRYLQAKMYDDGQDRNDDGQDRNDDGQDRNDDDDDAAAEVNHPSAKA